MQWPKLPMIYAALTSRVFLAAFSFQLSFQSYIVIQVISKDLKNQRGWFFENWRIVRNSRSFRWGVSVPCRHGRNHKGGPRASLFRCKGWKLENPDRKAKYKENIGKYGGRKSCCAVLRKDSLRQVQLVDTTTYLHTLTDETSRLCNGSDLRVLSTMDAMKWEVGLALSTNNFQIMSDVGLHGDFLFVVVDVQSIQSISVPLVINSRSNSRVFGSF